jgi:undecaprenyl-diphosphatase
MGDAAGEPLPIVQAVALGLLHGPAELLPISSSGHVTLVPWLLGWSYPRLDPELRKSFEIALHAGTAAALLVGLRVEVSEAARGLDRRRAALVALSFAPAALVGYLFERPIEQRLGTPATIAAGLLGGSIAMAAADRLGPTSRRREDAGAIDGLALGLAQAVSLIPGVSRNGATLAAARARGFSRRDANVLSRHVALPIIVAASALKGARLARSLRAREPVLTASVPALAAGASAAFASTLASTWLISQVERDRSLAPYAVYRTLLAGLTIRRLRQNRSR